MQSWPGFRLWVQAPLRPLVLLLLRRFARQSRSLGGLCPDATLTSARELYSAYCIWGAACVYHRLGLFQLFRFAEREIWKGSCGCDLDSGAFGTLTNSYGAVLVRRPDQQFGCWCSNISERNVWNISKLVRERCARIHANDRDLYYLHDS